MSEKSPGDRLPSQETALAADMGQQMAERFLQLHGRPLPLTDVEFAGMLGIAFALGRESIAGKAKP